LEWLLEAGAGAWAWVGADFAAALGEADLATPCDADFVGGFAVDVLAGGFLVVAFLAGVVLT
jgi:hypothetical protein